MTGTVCSSWQSGNENIIRVHLGILPDDKTIIKSYIISVHHLFTCKERLPYLEPCEDGQLQYHSPGPHVGEVHPQADRRNQQVWIHRINHEPWSCSSASCFHSGSHSQALGRNSGSRERRRLETDPLDTEAWDWNCTQTWDSDIRTISRWRYHWTHVWQCAGWQQGSSHSNT